MGSYSHMDKSLSKIKSNIRSALKENVDLMKYLIHDYDDPLSHQITDEQIEEAFKEDKTSSQQRVFRTFLINRTDDRVVSELRIYTGILKIINQYKTEVFVGIDIITHSDLEVIKNQNRSDILFSLTADTLHGLDVGVSAPLLIAENRPFTFGKYNDKFIGCTLLFHTVVAAS